MSRFTLQKQSAKVQHVNLREEKHGEDPVLGADVKLVFDASNDFLGQLSPTLKSALYASDVEATGQISLVDAEQHLPVLRYPQLGPLTWAGDFAAELTLHGAKKADDVVFERATIGKISLCPKEGGTVEVTCRAQVHPGPEGAGALAAMLGHTPKVSVQPTDAAPSSGAVE